MNEYIFYTTEGYTYPPKEDMEIENCQVLGRAYGETAKEAKVNLLQRCPWIQESGFDIEEIICKQLLNDETKEDIRTIVQYLFVDEHRHFYESESQATIFTTHFFV